MRIIELSEAAEALAEAKVEERTIKDVAILAPESRNLTDGRPRRYALPGMQAAVPLYDGMAVLIDHKPTEERQRSARDLAGVICSPRFDGQRIRGDIECYATPEGDRLLSIAKAKKPVGGLSHVAEGRVSKTEKGLIEGIDRVLNVAFVLAPATTKSLSEGEQDPDAEGTDVTFKSVSELEAAHPDLVKEIRDAERKKLSAGSELEAAKAEAKAAGERAAKAEGVIAAAQSKGKILKEARDAGLSQPSVERLCKIAEARNYQGCETLVSEEIAYLNAIGARPGSVTSSGPGQNAPAGGDGELVSALSEVFLEGFGFEAPKPEAKK